MTQESSISMQQFSRTFLAASISTALLVPTALAESNDSVQEMPVIDQCLISDQPDDFSAPITIEADHLQAVGGDKAVYSGDVEVRQSNKVIKADSVTLHQQEQVVIADGNVSFNDGQVHATSDRVSNNLKEDTFELRNTEYKFLCQQGRGDAYYVAKTGQAVYELEDGSITSCPEDDNSWRLVAASIEIDQDEETATFYHPRFEVLDVPVFYVPYLTLPVGNTRKTGFLFPSISFGSKDGIEAEIPFYWNIAPNYDLTLTTFYMQQRGVKLDTDFRYLIDGWGTGELKGEYLQSDKKFNDEHRWGYQYKHSGIIADQWLLDIDYSKVSDIDYFRDLSSDLGKREDGQLLQQGEVTYRSSSWDMSLQVRDFQILLPDGQQPYRLLPQLALNYYTPLWGDYVQFDVKSQLSRFDTQDVSRPNAVRAHIEPGITVPLSNSWGAWTTEARWLGTYYQQDLDKVSGNTAEIAKLDEEVSRSIPEFRSHGIIYLEREAKVFDGYTQSLEPQVQYLYVPELDQTNIHTYDTTELQTDYYGLFRNRKFSNIDRIAAANQFSYGASTRFFDDEYKERLSISFGQIYYIDKTTKSTTTTQTEEISNFSSWAVETDFNYDDFLFYHGSIQYDIDLGEMQLASSTLEYQFDGGFVQTNYRYVTKDYVTSNVSLGNIDQITNEGISQAGLVTAYEFSPNWSASAQYYHDLTEDIAMEWLASARYQSDCWYIGFTYSNRLLGWKDDSQIGGPGNSADYESNVGINFGIQGFATKARSYTAAKELESSDNAITYGRPFYLNK